MLVIVVNIFVSIVSFLSVLWRATLPTHPTLAALQLCATYYHRKLHSVAFVSTRWINLQENSLWNSLAGALFYNLQDS